MTFRSKLLVAFAVTVLVAVGLDSFIVAESAAHRSQSLAAIFLHGFGASGEDLVPLAEEFVHRDPSLAEKVTFLFPAAPLEPT